MTIKNNTRRSFIKGSAVAGLSASGSLAALAQPLALADLDRPVAGILATYGAARSVDAKNGIARVSVDVKGLGDFARSFEQFTQISDQVHVENDNVTFAYGKTTYIIENHAA